MSKPRPFQRITNDATEKITPDDLAYLRTLSENEKNK